MVRARNLKPSFFRDAELVECEPWVRLLFAGLWTVADRRGRFVDRPKQIKIDVFPADDFDVDAGLAELARRRLIIRYEVGGVRYAQVRTFESHQHPHQNEPESTIPPAPEGHESPPVHAPEGHESNRADSGLLNADSGLLIIAPGDARAPVGAAPAPARETPAARRKPRATMMPEGWVPDESVWSWSSAKGMDRDHVTRELERFRLAAAAKGYVYVDWDAAFRKWLTSQYAQPRASPVATAGANGNRPFNKTEHTLAMLGRMESRIRARAEAGARDGP